MQISERLVCLKSDMAAATERNESTIAELKQELASMQVFKQEAEKISEEKTKELEDKEEYCEELVRL